MKAKHRILTASVYASPAATRANTARNQWTNGDEVAVEMNGVVKRYLGSAPAVKPFNTSER